MEGVYASVSQSVTQQAGRQAGRQAGSRRGEKQQNKSKAKQKQSAGCGGGAESVQTPHHPSSTALVRVDVQTARPITIAIVAVSIMTIRQVASDDGDDIDDGHQGHDGDERGATRKVDRIHAPPKTRSKERNSEPVV